MTKRDLESKKEQLKKYLALAKVYSRLSLKELTANNDKRLAAERALFLVAQASIDLAEAYGRLKSFRRPSSMHEAIAILREHGTIDEKLEERLLKMVGFRNVLTHGYSKIDYEKVMHVLKHGLNDVAQFLRALK